VKLSQSSTARKKVFEYDFAELEIKGRSARGNTITKYPIRKVELLKAGTSTLSKLDLWYDADTGRLNKDKRGKYLGKFDGDDQLIAFMRNGSYKITNYDMTNRYEPEKTLLVEKFNQQKPVSAVYVDGETKQYMVKRFMVETSTVDKEFGFISETIGSRLVAATTSETPEVELEVVKGKDKGKSNEIVNLEDIIDVKGWKALGNRLSQFKVTKVSLVQDEEAGPEAEVTESDVEASETEKDSQSLKKKEEPAQPDPNQWLEKGDQASLFAEPPKPQQQVQQKPSQPRQKVKAEQQSLFGESPQSEKSKDKKNEVEHPDALSEHLTDAEKPNKETGREFGVGETIELEI
jgi:topoisomerase IV subunit A